MAQATSFLRAHPDEGAGKRLPTAPLGECRHFHHVSAVLTLGFVEATRSRAGLPFSCDPVSAHPVCDALRWPTCGRERCTIFFFFVCVCAFFDSLYAEQVNESLPCIYLISQQSRDSVVTSVAGMLLYVSWRLKNKLCTCH